MVRRNLLTVLVFALLVTLPGCLARHVSKDIPPPGGCDKCLRIPIGGNWSAMISPVDFGGDPATGALEYKLLVESIPVHEKVSGGRIKVYLDEFSPPPQSEDDRGAVQCFLCHKSPDKAHSPLTGTFPHPWGR